MTTKTETLRAELAQTSDGVVTHADRHIVRHVASDGETYSCAWIGEPTRGEIAYEGPADDVDDAAFLALAE